jgi:glycosyltransferase involved in cell wall biosynthesis
MSRRLIHMANYPNEHPGSYIPWLLAVMDEAATRGFECEAVFPRSVENASWVAGFVDRGVKLYFVPSAGRRAMTKRVGEIVGDDPRPTLLHTHFTKFDIPAERAARDLPDCHVFWHIHTVLAEDRVTILRNNLKFRMFSSGVDRVLVPAENIGEGLIGRSAPAEKVMLMPSAIDPSAYIPPSREQHEAARHHWEIPGDASVLLHIGRAWKLKGGPEFVRAVKLLREQEVDVIGLTLRGGEEAEREREELGLGDDLRVLDRVEDIRSLYAVADCFVAPSQGEGMPFSIVESLASGVPVVASDLPGHRFLADHTAACRIVSQDPADIAATIRAMLERPEEQVVSDGLEGRAWIEENLSLDATAAQMVDSYLEALGASEA